MSTLLLDDPATTDTPNVEAADRLRTTMAAVRVCFTWFGTRKTLSPEQKAQAAESFGAEGQYLTAGKKLLDGTHPAFKTVTAIRGRIISFWKGISLPFPEPGLRLIRQQDIAAFDVQMTTLRVEVEEAVGDGVELEAGDGARRLGVRQEVVPLEQLVQHDPVDEATQADTHQQGGQTIQTR